MGSLQIQEIHGISSSITGVGDFGSLADIEMTFRDGEAFLNFQRCLHHGSDETLIHMPFDVAMEEPYSRVVGLKSQDNVTFWP